MVDPELLDIPAMRILKLPEVQAEIFETMFRENALSFPSPQRYKFRVLKKIIGALEQSIVDPEQDVGSPLSSAVLLQISV